MSRLARYLSTVMSAVVAVALSGVALLASPPAPAAAAPTTVTIPVGPLTNMDPSIWDAGNSVKTGLVFQSLWGYNQNGQVVPMIASHWKVSDNGLVWTIWLRHNARWSNGQPVTAQDFYFAWMRLTQATGAAIWASIMNHVMNAYLYAAKAVPASAVGVKVINDYELQLTLSGPLDIRGQFAYPASMPVYPPAVEAHPTNWFMPPYFVGDGPYTIKSFVPNGEVVLVKNPYYVPPPGVPVSNVQQINMIPPPSTMLEDYEANVVDIAPISSPSDYVYAKQHFGSQLHGVLTSSTAYLEWDKAPEMSPLYNKDFREAVAYAINRAPLVNPVLSGMAVATYTAGPPNWPTARYIHNPYVYNLAKARELEAKAGYPNGKGLPTLYFYTLPQTVDPRMFSLAEAVVAELKSALNINFKIETINNQIYGELGYNGVTPGILPGYYIAYGAGNGPTPGGMSVQVQQNINDGAPCCLGSYYFQQYAWHNFYEYPYDPLEVKAWGNPNDPNAGTKWSQWVPIINAAQQAIKWLNAYYAAHKGITYFMYPPGSPPLEQQLQTYINGWKTATTPAAKHAAWVNLWKWAGTWSPYAASTSLGIVDTPWVLQHQPPLLTEATTLWGELQMAAPSYNAAVHLAAQLAQVIINSAYVVPLVSFYSYYLEKPWLHGMVVTSHGWYQFEYLHVGR